MPSATVIDSQSVKTTQAGDPRGYDAGKKIMGRKRHDMVDTDGRALELLSEFQPEFITHLPAESHLNHSIDGPDAFVQTNVVGTYAMLTEARTHWLALDEDAKRAFRFHHISTDEVYGSLGKTGLFAEETPYDPRLPYSASKAGSDHLVSA